MMSLERDKVVPLCKNCHSLENARIFNDFKDIILREDLFNNSAEELHQIVFDYVKERKNKHVKNYKFRVIEWIKKRFIIEQIYNGKCIGCRKINVKQNLPALDFHHITITMEKDKLSWYKIKKYGLNEICEILVKENCICLCSNCHTLLHATKFVLVADALLEKQYSNQVKALYEKISRNSKNFKLKMITFKDPLNLLFKQGEIWKKYILHLYNLIQIEGIDMIISIKIKNNLNISNRHLRRVIENLRKRKLIEIILNDENLYLRLTKIAHEELKELLNEERYSHYLKKIKKKVLAQHGISINDKLVSYSNRGPGVSPRS